jgi:hypothetical protein
MDRFVDASGYEVLADICPDGGHIGADAATNWSPLWTASRGLAQCRT